MGYEPRILNRAELSSEAIGLLASGIDVHEAKCGYDARRADAEEVIEAGCRVFSEAAARRDSDRTQVDPADDDAMRAGEALKNLGYAQRDAADFGFAEYLRAWRARNPAQYEPC